MSRTIDSSHPGKRLVFQYSIANLQSARSRKRTAGDQATPPPAPTPRPSDPAISPEVTAPSVETPPEPPVAAQEPPAPPVQDVPAPVDHGAEGDLSEGPIKVAQPTLVEARQEIEASDEEIEPPAPQQVVRVPSENVARNALMLAIQTTSSAIVDAVMAQVQAELAERVVGLMQVVQDSTQDAPTAAELAERLSTVMSSNQQRKRMKTVLIIGLLPSQAGQIVTEFGDCFELKFWKDENPSMLKQFARNADHIISFVSKVSHAAERLLETAGKPIIRCPGGMTTLRAKLTDLYVEGNPEVLNAKT